MQLKFTRPDASQLAIRLYDRSLHPELFNTVAEARLRCDRFEARLRICDGGHVIEFHHNDDVFTDVVGSADQELPERGRCFGYHLRGSRDAAHTLSRGLKYYCSAQVEVLDAEVFSEIDAELANDARTAFLSYRFPAAHRFSQPPLGLLQAELTAESLVVHAFHTFPDDLSVLRTQSLLEL